MNDELRAVEESFDYSTEDYSAPEESAVATSPEPEIPEYLNETYWWAYLHPKSFYFFEREWVVNLILWGNMNRLTKAVLDEVAVKPDSRVLQVACVYGDFSNRVADHLTASGSRLDVLDVAPIQIENVRDKLARHDNVTAHLQDSTAMAFPANSFDETVIYFLLHEQPEDARRKTIAEAIRVTRPGGKVIMVDYHGPKKSNPMRYVMKPILTWLEPYAMDLWQQELPAFFPAGIQPRQVQSEFFFGGLYQKIVVNL